MINQVNMLPVNIYQAIPHKNKTRYSVYFGNNIHSHRKKKKNDIPLITRFQASVATILALLGGSAGIAPGFLQSSAAPRTSIGSCSTRHDTSVQVTIPSDLPAVGDYYGEVEHDDRKTGSYHHNNPNKGDKPKHDPLSDLLKELREIVDRRRNNHEAHDRPQNVIVGGKNK